jgi:hypothetical protein
MRTRVKNVRVVLPAMLASGAIAAAIAGCGGGIGGHSGAGSDASHSRPSATHAMAQRGTPSAAAAGIPQHNGGDMDIDNNGGPSDGDGNQ